MIFLPIVERELRAQSRLPFTYALRVIGGAALLGVSLVFSLYYGLTPSLGGQLFTCLNCALFFAIWILVPLLCADCISRERREGTLGLLFLTPLSARGVVLAKGLVHGLRSVSILLAVLPIITIPLLLGGVTWSGIILSIMMNFSSVCWALAAGMLASSLGKKWARSLLLAYLLAAGFGFLFLLAAGGNTQLLLGGGIRSMYFTATRGYERTITIGLLTATNLDGWWSRMLGGVSTAAQSAQLLGQARIVMVSFLSLLVVIEIAAFNLRRNWREEPPSARRAWIERQLFTPILLVSFLRGWMRRKLDRNPIGWLEQRTWSGRLVTWGWFAVMISIYSTAFSSNYVSRALDPLQRFMAWLLLGILAMSAAGSFQRERESGVLELLMVSPLSVNQIIGGRLRGLWSQFFPAFAALLGIWLYLLSIFPARETASDLIRFFCGAFFTLPVIGLYYSLRRANFISAFLFTVAIGLMLPFGLRSALNGGLEYILGLSSYSLAGFALSPGDDSIGTLLLCALLRFTSAPFFITFLQLLLAGRIGWRLYRDMARRNFAFARTRT